MTKMLVLMALIALQCCGTALGQGSCSLPNYNAGSTRQSFKGKKMANCKNVCQVSNCDAVVHDPATGTCTVKNLLKSSAPKPVTDGTTLLVLKPCEELSPVFEAALVDIGLVEESTETPESLPDGACVITDHDIGRDRTPKMTFTATGMANCQAICQVIGSCAAVTYASSTKTCTIKAIGPSSVPYAVPAGIHELSLPTPCDQLPATYTAVLPAGSYTVDPPLGVTTPGSEVPTATDPANVPADTEAQGAANSETAKEDPIVIASSTMGGRANAAPAVLAVALFVLQLFV